MNNNKSFGRSRRVVDDRRFIGRRRRFYFQVTNIPHVNNVVHKDDRMEEEMSDLSFEGSYDVEAVTVPVTICLAIMVGWVGLNEPPEDVINAD